MVEHGRAVEQDLENDDPKGRRTQHDNGRCLDHHREDDLNRVKPGASGDIIIHVRMVHHVQTPEGGNSMKHDVLEIDDEIESAVEAAMAAPEPKPEDTLEDLFVE